MFHRTRREFLADVGRGTLIAAVGFHTAVELGLAPAEAAAGDDRLKFGKMEALVELMQTHDGEALLPLVAEKLRGGTSLKEIVAAAALANARTFGGQDYVGFHTMMALAPSFAMSQQLAGEQQALPVLKVLVRNSHRITEHGGVDSEILHLVEENPAIGSSADGKALLEAVHKQDVARAEQIFASIAHKPADEALEQLLVAVQDQTEVHRIVMPYRAYDLLDVVGAEHAQTLLRQSVRYCVMNDKYRDRMPGGRDVLPKLLDQYRLHDSAASKSREADEAWVSSLVEQIFRAQPAEAAEAVAGAIAEGFPLNEIGLALSLAANQLVLRDAGRPAEQARPPEKPVGSIHGDSIGVHASDSANAWRHLAQVGSRRNRIACLILGAHQVASDRTNRGGDFLNWQPYPRSEHLEKITAKTPEDLLAAAEGAIRENDQAKAAAAVAKYGQATADSRPVFDLLLKYAVSEDGALHAEKYYQTVTEDYHDSRPAFRQRLLAGLARVTASAYGRPAPGMAEARKLLKV